MKKLMLGLIALGCVVTTSAIAAPGVGDVAASTAATSSHSIVQKAYYYRRWHHRWYGPRYGYGFYGGPGWGYGYRGCYGARRLCADRWGWGGPGFRRCLWRHGC